MKIEGDAPGHRPSRFPASGTERCLRETIVANKRLVICIALALILATAFLINLWFVAHDNRPPPWDYATYLTSSLRLYDAARLGSLNELSATLGNPYRPPLVPLAALPFYALFGTSYAAAMLVNLVFIAILVLSTYGLAMEMLHSSWPALAAAGVVCTLPGVIAYTRVYGLDLPTTAFVAAGLYLTAASQGFKIRSTSIALGVVVGLGMLTKWTYFVFVAPMIILELLRYRRAINPKNFILSGLVAMGICSMWYIYAFQLGLIRTLIYYSWGPGAKLYSPSSSMFDLAAFLYYPRMLYDLLIGPFYAIALIPPFCIALLFATKRRSFQGSRLALSLVLSFLMPLAVFSFLEDKSLRFLLPALPCLVVLLVCTSWQIHLRRVRVGHLLLLVVVIVGSCISVVGSLQPSVGSRFGIYEPWTISDQYSGYNNYSPPKPYDWKLEKVIELISSMDPDASVGVLANHWVYNQDTLTYYALRLGFERLTFRDFRDLQVFPPYDDLNNYDFILVKTGEIGGGDTQSVTRILERLKNPDDSFYADHEMIQSCALPDGSQLFVFAKKTMNAFPDTNPASYPSLPRVAQDSTMEMSRFGPSSYVAPTRQPILLTPP
jgi:hypothetical protein